MRMTSLNGKNPSELNIVQLKRWLVCRGAPVNGKKPELIQRYADRFILSSCDFECQGL